MKLQRIRSRSYVVTKSKNIEALEVQGGEGVITIIGPAAAAAVPLCKVRVDGTGSRATFFSTKDFHRDF